MIIWATAFSTIPAVPSANFLAERQVGTVGVPMSWSTRGMMCSQPKLPSAAQRSTASSSPSTISFLPAALNCCLTSTRISARTSADSATALHQGRGGGTVAAR